jgi:hypothetical protein
MRAVIPVVGRASPPGVTRRINGAAKIGDVGLRFANPTYVSVFYIANIAV